MPFKIDIHESATMHEYLHADGWGPISVNTRVNSCFVLGTLVGNINCKTLWLCRLLRLNI